MAAVVAILLLFSSLYLSGASRPAGLQLGSQQHLWAPHSRALRQNELRPPAQDLAGPSSTPTSLDTKTSSNSTGQQPPRPPEPPLGQAAAPAAGSAATAAGAAPSIAPAPPPAGPPAPPAAAPPADPQAPWQQRRTLQLPPHVYLISFVMLLAIMAGLLSCHCYRMCRIARRMRQAAELGVTVSSAGSMLSKRTPQSVIESLPVRKYSSIHSQRSAKSAPPFGSKGAAQQQPGSTAANGDGSNRMDTFVAAAVQLREQLSRASGISSFSFGRSGSSTTAAAAAAGANSSGQVELQAPAAAATVTAVGVPSLQHSASSGSNVRLSLGSDPREVAMSPPLAAAAAATATCSLAAAPGFSSSNSAVSFTATPQAAAGRIVGASGCSSNGAEPCAICFEDFTDNDDVKQLPCRHFYHCSCIDEWLVRDVTCPLCKAPVLDQQLLEQQQRMAAALEASFGHLGAAARRQHMQQLQQERRERRRSRSNRSGIGAAPAAVAAMAGAEVGGEQHRQRQQQPRGPAPAAAGQDSGSSSGTSRRGSSTARELLSLASLTALSFHGRGRAHIRSSGSGRQATGTTSSAATTGAAGAAAAADVEMGAPSARS